MSIGMQTAHDPAAMERVERARYLQAAGQHRLADEHWRAIERDADREARAEQDEADALEHAEGAAHNATLDLQDARLRAWRER